MLKGTKHISFRKVNRNLARDKKITTVQKYGNNNIKMFRAKDDLQIDFRIVHTIMSNTKTKMYVQT